MFLAESAPAWDPILQYGAFGLCAFLAVGFFTFCRFLMRSHHEERVELVKALAGETETLRGICVTGQISLDNNTEALRRITEALKDRPCLAADSRVQGTPS
jgi:hypothetical protein